MASDRVTADGARARLQLAIGSLAELRDELPAESGARAFAAAGRRDGDWLVVTLHPAPPAGPDPKRLRERLDILRALGRSAICVPIECGEVMGRAWVVEATPPGESVRERLEAGPITIRHGVAVMREVSRALVTVHRRGVTLGSISADSVRLAGGGAVVCGALVAPDVRPEDDLDALGAVIWMLLAGRERVSPGRRLSGLRRSVPPALDDLLAAMVDARPERRPRRADAVLAALDRVPTGRVGSLPSLVDGGFFDVRPRRRVGWLLAAAALLTVIALLALNRG